MKAPFRLYGHLTNLDTASKNLCRTLVAHCELEESKTVLDFAYEGPHLDAQNLLEKLAACLPVNARGIIDIIDHQEWTMQRCSLVRGSFQCQAIALDNALDTAYATENRNSPTSERR